MKINSFTVKQSLRIIALVAWLSWSARATDYYVSPLGNNAQTGQTPATAWQTIERVNSHPFSAGDRILFQGGQTFTGNLLFDTTDKGTPDQPITVGSYGTGRATIQGGLGNGILIYNTAGVILRDLVIIGAGPQVNQGHGIIFYTDLPGNVRLRNAQIENVSVSGFKFGIVFGGEQGTSGFEDVRVTRTDSHNNQRHGMFMYGLANYAHRNVYVGDCRFYDNPGDPNYTRSHSGNGVVLGQVNGGVIERCQAWNNGSLCPSPAGPVGIWAYESTNIKIQFCESFANRTNSRADGGGFDLDGGVTNSVMQYNYSHDNDGAGFGLYQYTGASAWRNNILRFNVSENDGRKNGYGGITIWTEEPGFEQAQIYHNTVYCSGASNAVKFLTPDGYNAVYLRNNLFMTANGAALVNSPELVSGALFQGNNYWDYDGKFAVRMGTRVFASLPAWSTDTGQELLAGAPVGHSINPLLTAPGAGGTMWTPEGLLNLTAYKLRSDSPARQRGLSLISLFGLDLGVQDFYRTPLNPVATADLGAHQFVPAVVGLAAPVTLKISTCAPEQALLVWEDRTDNESGFRIERSLGGAPFQEIGITGPNVTTYLDAELPRNRSRCASVYRVRSWNANGFSAYSNEAGAFAREPMRRPVNGRTIQP